MQILAVDIFRDEDLSTIFLRKNSRREILLKINIRAFFYENLRIQIPFFFQREFSCWFNSLGIKCVHFLFSGQTKNKRREIKLLISNKIFSSNSRSLLSNCNTKFSSSFVCRVSSSVSFHRK